MMKKFLLLCFNLLIFSCFTAFGQVKPGKASFYGDRFQNRKTASGERYHKDSLTAAHRTLPFGTVVKVTNAVTKKFVIVRINDRGPFIKGRNIDLSKAAAKEIGMLQAGVAKVEIEVLQPDEISLSKNNTEEKPLHESAVNTSVYMVQAGSFSDYNNALKLKRSLLQIGYANAQIDTVKRGDDLLYKISLGPYIEDKALQTITKLKEQSFDGFVVKL